MKNLKTILVSIIFISTTLASFTNLEARMLHKSPQHVRNKTKAIDTGGSSYANTSQPETRYYAATAFAIGALAIILGLAKQNR